MNRKISLIAALLTLALPFSAAGGVTYNGPTVVNGITFYYVNTNLNTLLPLIGNTGSLGGAPTGTYWLPGFSNWKNNNNINQYSSGWYNPATTIGGAAVRYPNFFGLMTPFFIYQPYDASSGSYAGSLYTNGGTQGSLNLNGSMATNFTYAIAVSQ